MATITWTSTAAKNWSDPTAWSSSTVPGINDVALFNADSQGSCTVDADITVGDFSFDNFSGTFTAGAHAITTRDWVFSGTTTGVVSVAGATLNVSGEYDLTGTNAASYVTSTDLTDVTTLNMLPNWDGSTTRRQMMLAAVANVRYAAVNISDGAYVLWTGYRYVYIAGSTIAGNIEISAALNASGNPIWSSPTELYDDPESPGATYIFTDTATFVGAKWSPRRSTLSGNLKSINVSVLQALYQIVLDGELSSSVELRLTRHDTLSYTSRFTENACVYDLLITYANAIGTTTLSFEEGSEIRGDIFGVASSGQTIIDHLPLRGTADQDIDLTPFTNIPSADIQKTAGTVSNAYGSAFVISDDSTCENIANSGTIEVPESTKLTTRYTAVGAARLEGTGTIRTDRSLTRVLA